MDYHHYLQYLGIIWKRVREEYNAAMDYHSQTNELLSSRQENSNQFRIVAIKRHKTLTILQCDMEAFIIFVRIFLDKVGKLIEVLIELPSGTTIGNSFTDHKNYFVQHRDIRPPYSQLLKDETNWYEQDLLLWRDKILTHGKTLNAGSSVSPNRGIQYIKSIGVHEIRKKDEIKFYRIKEKYEHKYPDLKITNNPYMMIEEFRDEISRRNIKLDKEDLDDLGEIVSVAGTSLDIRQVARNVKNYTEKTANMFS